MKNHPLYQKLKLIALDENYTVEQVQSLSFIEVTTLLGERPGSTTFLENMKEGIFVVLQNRDDECELQALQDQFKIYLDTNFPGWVAESDREGSKPFIKLWLKGKP
ncbi:MAG: hypothetical protein GWN67_04515 [Phycisphaerae bacterium]|nr:hypothetical protein [Phycisphaerae bacterium]NIP51186.1 hypothetical protein [Phycisphaerae bacterium]NIS50397.1 hypothetical protein [Phycisphaerae bacterium]NIU08127.1 hypothetical protein [Phycisphaerae bacterium]NIU55670.1 hypothetical protein [Phycisphaerae bacterium]